MDDFFLAPYCLYQLRDGKHEKTTSLRMINILVHDHSCAVLRPKRDELKIHPSTTED
jgi:hypothetical protein